MKREAAKQRQQQQEPRTTDAGVVEVEVAPFHWGYGVTAGGRFWDWMRGKSVPWLQGEIRVGERLVWEPEKDHARALVEVEKIVRHANGVFWIKSVALSGNGRGLVAWNTSYRFREACRRIPED